MGLLRERDLAHGSSIYEQSSTRKAVFAETVSVMESAEVWAARTCLPRGGEIADGSS